MLNRVTRKLKSLGAPKKIGVPVVIPELELMKDKIVLVTGGSGDIGLAIAKKIVDYGGSVILIGRNGQKLDDSVKSIGSNAAYVAGDITDISSHGKIIDECAQAFGKTPVALVNSAGCISDVNFGNITEDVWDDIMNVNVKGAVFFSQHLSNRWIEEHVRGNILNVSSASGIKPGWTPYQISKAALNSATVGMASMLIKHGIVVNAIAPGAVQSNAINGGSENIASSYPSGRLATLDEIAQWSVYLLSDLGGHTSGSILNVTGGNGIFHLER